jgi:hypothetical protein
MDLYDVVVTRMCMYRFPLEARRVIHELFDVTAVVRSSTHSPR